MSKIFEDIRNEISECDILLRTLEKELKCITINIETSNLVYENLNK